MLILGIHMSDKLIHTTFCMIFPEMFNVHNYDIPHKGINIYAVRSLDVLHYYLYCMMRDAQHTSPWKTQCSFTTPLSQKGLRTDSIQCVP
jgi:hypothetical protein